MRNGYAIVADDIIRDLEKLAWKFNWSEEQLDYMIWELKTAQLRTGGLIWRNELPQAARV